MPAVEELGECRDTRASLRSRGNGPNSVSVHSQPLPTRSWTPQGLTPAGRAPAGTGSRDVKSKLPCPAGAAGPQGSPRLVAGRRSEGGAVTPLRSEGCGQPSRVRRGFRLADIHRHASGRGVLEHPAPGPPPLRQRATGSNRITLRDPERGVRACSRSPLPARVVPELRPIVAAIADELQVVGVRHALVRRCRTRRQGR